MALIETPQKDDAMFAPDFSLKNINGQILSYKDIQGKNGTFIMFICNHCPYVLAIIDRLVRDTKVLQEHDIGCAAIMPNDTERYPADSFENMKIFSDQHGFTFPYLIDETQNIAREYGAVCTPDLYGFDRSNKLIYRGRLDSAGKNPETSDTVSELKNAMLDTARNIRYTAKQFPSMGCSIKWK